MHGIIITSQISHRPTLSHSRTRTHVDTHTHTYIHKQETVRSGNKLSLPRWTCTEKRKHREESARVWYGESECVRTKFSHSYTRRAYERAQSRTHTHTRIDMVVWRDCAMSICQKRKRRGNEHTQETASIE